MWCTLLNFGFLFGFQLQSQIEDLQQEASLLKNQLDTERSSNKNLEGLLQNNREKEFQFQLSLQEKEAEVQMLKDRLSLNESKMWVLFRSLIKYWLDSPWVRVKCECLDNSIRVRCNQQERYKYSLDNR